MVQRKRGGTGFGLFVFMGGFIGLAGLAGLVYLYFFTNALGWGGPEISRWQVNNDLSQITDGQFRWDVRYHTGKENRFRGLVRHASQVRMPVYPLITHDILVTTGDFANRSRVTTQVNVFQHHFYWQAQQNSRPEGTINLLHTVPLNQEVYAKLLKIRSGDHVTVAGWEIDKILAFDLRANRDSGYWQDDGCDSILVTDVSWDQ